jgi:hypothetical protein
MMEKARPVLILNIPLADTDRAVLTVYFTARLCGDLSSRLP